MVRRSLESGDAAGERTARAVPMQQSDPRSRLVVGGRGQSFSPVRIGNKTDDALLRSVIAWVGEETLKVQELCLSLSAAFLFALETGHNSVPVQRRFQGGHRLLLSTQRSAELAPATQKLMRGSSTATSRIHRDAHQHQPAPATTTTIP